MAKPFLRGDWYHYDIQRSNNRYSGACGTKDKQTAKKIVAKIENDLALGKFDIVEGTNKKTQLFKNAVATYIEVNKGQWSDKTLAMHKTSLPKVLDFFGNLILNQITVDDLKIYRTMRGAQFTTRGTVPSNRTINTELILVRQVMMDAKLWVRLIEGSGFEMLEENQTVGIALEKDEAVKLLLACQEVTSRVLYPVVMLSIFTGIRCSELKDLHWHQIDFNRKMLTVGESKTKAGKGRKIPLMPQAVEMLRDWKSKFPGLPTHYVFPAEQYAHGKITRTDLDQPYTSFTTSWSHARTASGVNCRWHDLRHTCATIMGESGATRATLKSLHGWMTEAQLDRYIKAIRDAKVTAAESISEFFADFFNQQQMETGKEMIQ